MTTAQVCEPGCTSGYCHTQQVPDTAAAVSCTHILMSLQLYGGVHNAISCLLSFRVGYGIGLEELLSDVGLVSRVVNTDVYVSVCCSCGGLH